MTETSSKDLAQDPELKKLTAARGTVRGTLTRLLKEVEKFNSSTDRDKVQVKLESLPALREKIVEIHTDILCKIGDRKAEVDAAEEYLAEFEALFDDALVLIKKLQKTNVNVNAPDQSSIAPGHKPSAKLPQIQLPSFNGSYTAWRSFANAFKSLIHDEPSIDKCSKLHYLRSSLTGEALQAIAAVEISDENYDIAWDLLERRYENKRLIVDDHVRSILDLAIVQKSSCTGLLKLLNDVTYHVAALKSLKYEVDTWNVMLVPIITRKLDVESSQLWENTLDTDVPTYNDLLEFLQKRCRLLKSLENRKGVTERHQDRSHDSTKHPQRRDIKVQRTYVATKNESKRSCLICNSTSHTLLECVEFLNLSPGERLKKCTSLQLCKNCLASKFHKTIACKSRSRCAICKQLHNSLLHLPVNDRNEPSPPGQVHPEVNSSTATHCCFPNQVLLSTAVILISAADDNWIPCRTLLDPGSQLNFLTEHFVRKLNAEKIPIKFDIAGINNARSKVQFRTKVRVKSGVNGDFSATIDCMVLDQITQNLPSISFDEKSLKIPADLELADPQFFKSGPIHCLLGAEIFWELLLHEQIRIPGQSTLMLTNSYLGWLVGGKMNVCRKGTQRNSTRNSMCHITTLEDLNRQMEHFWVQEEVPSINKNWTKEEIACEQNFVRTFSRDEEGRFVVDLPINGEIDLGDSETQARKRFSLLEKRFRRDPDFQSQYSQGINQYLNQGHMEMVPEEEINNHPQFYLPHHAVPKGNKIRIVFDGSACSRNQKSLNDNLMKGPLLQDDLFSILVRFRLGQFAFTADVRDMYRQIKVNRKHADLQRILWRDNPAEEVKIYRLLRVTFGIKPSSFLSIRAIQQLAKESAGTYPEAAEIIMGSTYVDDVLATFHNLGDAVRAKEQLENMLSQGCFRLAKWASNSHVLLENTDKGGGVVIKLDKEGLSKTLGLFWDCSKDTFVFKINLGNPERITKRHILSVVSQ